MDSALEREQRGEIDDRAAAAGGAAGGLREHVGADGAAQGEDGGEVDLEDLARGGGDALVGERGRAGAGFWGRDFGGGGFCGGALHFVPVRVWELVGRVTALDAGAVDEDVDAVAGGEDGGEEGGDGGGGGQVGGEDGGVAGEGDDSGVGGGLGGVALGVVMLVGLPGELGSGVKGGGIPAPGEYLLRLRQVRSLQLVQYPWSHPSPMRSALVVRTCLGRCSPFLINSLSGRSVRRCKSTSNGNEGLVFERDVEALGLHLTA